MSDLSQFRDHARTMAASEHQFTCSKVTETWPPLTIRPSPDCTGCVTDSDRALWARLANEVDAYLGGADEDALWDTSAIEEVLAAARDDQTTQPDPER